MNEMQVKAVARKVRERCNVWALDAREADRLGL